jgi:hypothetical protein
VTVTPIVAFDQVREIIRAVFYCHHFNQFQLMAVHGSRNPDVPILLFRIHPPVRFSPHGSPLLLVSVIDYPRLEDLISQGKVDREHFQSDYHRLVTERVSKEVCTIRASTEEVNLLRYVLRVNSTRMRRSDWQSKNLPRDENSPSIATFISSLYTEWINNDCQEIENKLEEMNGRYTPLNPRYRKSCVACNVTKVDLKSCARCKYVHYCSISCQKNHWPVHKYECPKK